MTDTTTTESTAIAVLPVMDKTSISEIVKNNSVTIDENMAQANVKAGEIQEFLTDALTQMFASQNQTVAAVGELFRQVVQVEEIKKSIKDMINVFAIEKDDIIAKTMTTVDDSLGDINPLLRGARNSIENGVGFWSHLFGGSAKEQLVDAFQGLQGRIDSLSDTFHKAGVSLDKNEILLIGAGDNNGIVQRVGGRIAKLEGMANALEEINKNITHDPTKQMIAGLITEFRNLSMIQRDSLMRLLLLATMNGNSKLVLQSTEIEVFSTLEPLIAENIVGGEQEKVLQLRVKARAGLKALRTNSEQHITNIMKLTESDKVQMKSSMEESANRITNMIALAHQHEENLAKAQQAIDDYTPTLKAVVSNLDTEIDKYVKAQKETAGATAEIMSKMIEQKNVLTNLVEKR